MYLHVGTLTQGFSDFFLCVLFVVFNTKGVLRFTYTRKTLQSFAIPLFKISLSAPFFITYWVLFLYFQYQELCISMLQKKFAFLEHHNFTLDWSCFVFVFYLFTWDTLMHRYANCLGFVCIRKKVKEASDFKFAKQAKSCSL